MRTKDHTQIKIKIFFLNHKKIFNYFKVLFK